MGKIDFLSSQTEASIVGTESFATLASINELNAQGVYCLFAPNHVSPQGFSLKRPINAALGAINVSDDFLALSKVLEDAEIAGTKIVYQSSFPGQHAPSLVKNIHAVGAKVRSLLIDGHPVSPTLRFSEYRHIRDALNPKNTGEDGNGAQGNNVVIFPYHERQASGKQGFTQEEAYHQEAQRFYTRANEPEKYQFGLKPGFIHIARKTGSPIIPTYLYRKIDGSFFVNLGKPINISSRSDIQVVDEYLAEMRRIKQETENQLL